MLVAATCLIPCEAFWLLGGQDAAAQSTFLTICLVRVLLPTWHRPHVSMFLQEGHIKPPCLGQPSRPAQVAGQPAQCQHGWSQIRRTSVRRSLWMGQSSTTV